MHRIPTLVASLALLFSACTTEEATTDAVESSAQSLSAKYTTVRLQADLDHLTENERAMLPLLMKAADAMDRVFWQQAYGDKEALLGGIDDPELRRFAEINYGPWDRLAGNEPFVAGVGSKPAGANFYPADMTKDELALAIDEARAAGDDESAEDLSGLYSIVRRDDEGGLTTVPYSEAYAEEFGEAARYLEAAAALAEDDGLRNYLELRAKALLSDDYLDSDLAWMDMKSNRIDIVIGPIENYEDGLFGYRTSAEAYVLLKDLEWSGRLQRYAALLPRLQRALPVAEQYKQGTGIVAG